MTISLADQAGIVESLLDLPDIAEGQAFVMLRQVVASELGERQPIEVPAGLDARGRLFALVRACHRRWGGLRALAAGVDALYRGQPAAAEIRASVDRIAPEGLLDSAERRELIAILLGGEPPVEQRGLRDLLDGIRAARPLLTAPRLSLEEVLARLDDAEQDGEPPLLIFLSGMLSMVRPATQEALGAWLDKAFTRRQIRPAKAALWSAAATARVERRYLTVRVEEVGTRLTPSAASLRYRLDAWVTSSTGAVLGKAEVPETVGKEGVDKAGEHLLAALAPALSGGAGPVTVECLLPLSLLHHAVDRWCLPATGAGEVPVSLYCATVVRSLDRMRNGFSHEQWHRRWDRRNRDGRLYWLHRRADNNRPAEDCDLALGDFASSEAFFGYLADQAKDLVCLGLAYPHQMPDRPGTAELDGVAVAIGAGIPMLVWRRDGGETESLRQAVAQLVDASALDRLPEEILALRQRAPYAAAFGWASDVTIVWDDPHRMPEATFALSNPAPAERDLDGDSQKTAGRRGSGISGRAR